MNIKAKGSVLDKTVEEDKYATAIRERQECEKAVLNSPSKKKIVVAGPGTGKTHLFQKILEGKKNTLTLTFVNALVEDLSLELCGISDVKTLHGFARSVLKKATEKDIKIFPKLTGVIKEDAKILLNKEVDFDHIFHNRADAGNQIEFYKKRKDYYGHYGFPDIVFAVVKHFEKDRSKIPTYEQIVVDEFQDFNTLEVSLIDLLAEKSPILLAGDDDQALYESLKSASPKHIRQRHNEVNFGYISFRLPYCSRCTRVIVEATNDIVAGAKKDGYLSSRTNKPFQYFDDKDKDRVSDENPQLIYRQLYPSQIPWFIQDHIGKIAKEVRGKFTVLIICPTNIQCKIVVAALKNKGFENVQFMGKKGMEEPTLLDGLKLLLENKECNLGWRIIAKNLLKDTDFKTLLKETDKDDAKRFSDLIKADEKREVKKMLKTLRVVRDRKQMEDEDETKDENETEDKDKTDLAELLKKVGIDAYGIATDYLKDEIKFCKPNSNRPYLSIPEIRNIPITATTIERSKGLAADYVFITYFDDQYFIKDKSQVSDQDICKFIVALTRTRKKAFLISSDAKKRPVFLKWIDEKRILVDEGDG
ncbi:MAG: UvrD-helicase domain-containing protein [Sedimentisphaerales bacterium]|jgi:superfamily I DNA/RNA helicase